MSGGRWRDEKAGSGGVSGGRWRDEKKGRSLRNQLPSFRVMYLMM